MSNDAKALLFWFTALPTILVISLKIHGDITWNWMVVMAPVIVVMIYLFAARVIVFLLTALIKITELYLTRQDCK